MKSCFGPYTCPHCPRRGMCGTYQSLKQQLTPDKSTYELMIARPELACEPKML